MTVVYRATSNPHRFQYDELAREYKEYSIRFLEENAFRRDLLRNLREIFGHSDFLWMGLGLLGRLSLINAISRITDRLYEGRRYVLFLVDDNIFVRDFSLDEAIRVLASHPDAIGFSLRLGKNIDFCYPTRQYQRIPPHQSLSGGILKFDWTSAAGDFGYPLEISSSIFRVRDVVPLIRHFGFHNPNSLEAMLSGKRWLFSKCMPYLLSYSVSVTFCNPINIVQQDAANRAGTRNEYSSNNLLRLFDQDYRIDASKYSDFTPNSCHEEVELFMTAHEPVNTNRRSDL